MNFRYCLKCEEQTAHKRVLGVGTIIMAILTLGLWLLVIPFYPTRCIHCATPKWTTMDATDWWPNPKEKNYREKLANRKIGYVVLVVLFLIIMATGLLTNNLFTPKSNPQAYGTFTSAPK
jgi:hypothetical protein